MLSQSTLLDPRFKKRGFESDNMFKNAYDSIAKMASTTIIENETINPPVSESTISRPTTRSSVWDDFDREIADAINNNRNISWGIIELDQYLQETYLPRTGNPLQWWEEKKSNYPRLYQIVRKRFCVLATSVPCERVSSKSEYLINERRNRLKPKLVSQILFLNANMQ